MGYREERETLGLPSEHEFEVLKKIQLEGKKVYQFGELRFQSYIDTDVEALGGDQATKDGEEGAKKPIECDTGKIAEKGGSEDAAMEEATGAPDAPPKQCV